MTWCMPFRIPRNRASIYSLAIGCADQGLHLTIFGTVLGVQAALRTALFLAIVYAVLRYAVDYRHRQTAMEREFQNAREVQQVLVPETLPSIPGFNLTSAYKPAREVGGDFFQILTAGEGGALIVIGDVSGKGMPAAMTVSLLVGTMRTLAHYTQSPGEILTAMNYRMLNRSAGGFTTCLVVRVDHDGNSRQRTRDTWRRISMAANCHCRMACRWDWKRRQPTRNRHSRWGRTSSLLC